SYRATGEEMHSTRGRARLLFEMMRRPRDGGRFRDDIVREALDLCLSCKGCKGECPMTVDMATYKAEFLAHYYEKRWRTRNASAFGLLPYWVRAASLLPGVSNALLRAEPTSSLLKWAAGATLERRFPELAQRTFRRDWQPRGPRMDAENVILWLD